MGLQCIFKNGKSKIRTINYIGMLVMVEKDIRGGICDVFHGYVKVNNKYIKNMINIKKYQKKVTCR